MLIENCAQGGNRVDFGLLRYTDVAWMDDLPVSSPSTSGTMSQGLTAFFPPPYLLSFLIADVSEPLTDAPDLPAYMRSRMPGILGLTYRVADLTETETRSRPRFTRSTSR